MPWTTLRTWISGELVTAFQFNQQFRDNGNVLKTSISDTGHLSFPEPTEVVVDDGEITITQNVHIVRPSDSDGDVVDTITPPASGAPRLVILFGNADAEPVTISGAENLALAAGESVDCELSHLGMCIAFWWDDVNEFWIELFRNAGVGGGASTPFVVFTPAHNNPPASAYATPDTRNSHPVLDFDGSTDEEAVFKGVLPPGYAGGDLEVTVLVSFTSATSGTSRWQAAFERVALSSLDIDADSFDSFQSNGVGAPGTSGHVVACTITLTSAQIDGLLAGEPYRLKIRRDSDGTSGTDDITTDAELWAVTIAEVEA